MAGLFTAFLNPNVKPKYKIKKDYGDTITPAVASLVGNFIRDTAVSAGQIANEAANTGIGVPAAIPARLLFGPDYLARLGGKASPSVEESMKGEVTPMDIANVASVIPIPVGGAIRGGLLGARAGTKFLPKSMKGIKAIDNSVGVEKQASKIMSGKTAALIERGIGSAFVEATPDAILSSPALIDIAKSDLPTEQKAGLIAAIISGVALPGTSAVLKQKSKLKSAEKRVAAGKGTLTDVVRVETSNTPWAASDRALSSETSMPKEAIAALTQGGREGWQTKWDISSYENDPAFRTIIDDATSGRTNAEQARKAFVKWKQKRKEQGLSNPNIVKQTWDFLELNAKTGSLSRSGNSAKTSSVNPPNKAQRFRETLEGKADTIVYDLREKKLYEALVKSGEIVPGNVKTGARGTDIREFQLERKELDKWFKETFGITDPKRLQAMRERMYQALENIV